MFRNSLYFWYSSVQTQDRTVLFFSARNRAYVYMWRRHIMVACSPPKTIPCFVTCEGGSVSFYGLIHNTAGLSCTICFEHAYLLEATSELSVSWKQLLWVLGDPVYNSLLSLLKCACLRMEWDYIDLLKFRSPSPISYACGVYVTSVTLNCASFLLANYLLGVLCVNLAWTCIILMLWQPTFAVRFCTSRRWPEAASWIDTTDGWACE